MTKYTTPKPRDSVSDISLVRPDWLKDGGRKTEKLWLDKNENLDPELLAHIVGVVSDLPNQAVATYPNVAPVYRKLASFLGVSADKLLLTNGSDAAISSVFQAFINPGDFVLRTHPTFAMYDVYCKIFGAHQKTIPYEYSENGPVIGFDRFVSAIHDLRPKLVCLPNPDSPTGSVFEPEQLEALTQAAGNVGAIMLVDEVYVPFYPKTVLGLTEKYPHLVVIRSASKSWGLAGIRIGYCVASPELTDILHKVKPMYELGGFAAAILDHLLDNMQEMDASIRRLLNGKDYFAESMRQLGFEVPKTEGNFQLVGFGHYAPEIHNRLDSIVYYRQSFFEPCLSRYSRFSVTTVEQFRPVVATISECIEV